MEIVAYNGGLVASIAVIIFLAAKVRKASPTATFVIHKTFHNIPGGTAKQAALSSKSLKIDDARTEGILKEHLKLSSAQWRVHQHDNLVLTAEDALKADLIHEIADFRVPAGNNLFTI